jgi:Chromo (CHRromatin Organisation MOdifier) domain
MIKGIQKAWDKHIPFIQYCINSKISTRHRMMPFLVMFGRRPNELVNYQSHELISEDPTEDQIRLIQRQVDQMQLELFPLITQRSMITSEKYRRDFNKRYKLVKIPINSHVMLKDKLARDMFEAKYQGPFKVVARSHGGAYTLQDLDMQILPRHFPPSQLVPISDLPIFDDVSYEVEKIVDHRDDLNGREYLIKWKNYPEEENTWEPESNIDDDELIRRYMDHAKDRQDDNLEGSDVVNYINKSNIRDDVDPSVEVRSESRRYGSTQNELRIPKM